MRHPGFSVAAIVYLISGTYVHASFVDVLDVYWEFYQGGYVQEDIDSWHHKQQHIPGSPKQHDLLMTLGPATAVAMASMDIVQTEAAGVLELNAIFALSVSADVSNGFTEAAAQAFSGVSVFDVHFQIHERVTYTGSGPLWVGGEKFPSGSILSPGMYSFWYDDSFPGHPFFVQTPMIGMGEFITMDQSDGWEFHFAIPSPATMWLLLLGALSTESRRRIPEAPRMRVSAFV